MTNDVKKLFSNYIGENKVGEMKFAGNIWIISLSPVVPRLYLTRFRFLPGVLDRILYLKNGGKDACFFG